MASRPSRVASKPPRATPKQPRPRTSEALNKLMRKTFGIKRLRPGQTEVIANVLSGRDTLAIMPTGAGKSLCYQLPALPLPGVDELYAFFRDAGESVGRYHGRLPSKERKSQQDAFMNGASRIMVATNAFGMGIDKADIRAIIHYQIPGSLEAYYQESGRAGCDGEPACCTVLYDTKDKRVQQFFLARRYPSISELDQLYQAPETLAVNANETTLEALHEQLPSLPLNRIRVALKQMKDGGLVNIKAGSVSTASKRVVSEELYPVWRINICKKTSATATHSSE